ncbi:MAG: radical SAM protein [bacterium]|nr:radical SAM protein [bacterium]
MLENIYIFNPEYRLKSDKNRIIIYYRLGIPPVTDDISYILEFQHPVFAVLLSLFDGEKSLQKVSGEFSHLTGINHDSTFRLVSRLVENKTQVKVELNGDSFYFPKYTLVKATAQNKHLRVRYNPEDFLIPNHRLDFKTQRFHTPLDMMMVINNKCVTRCLYCYTNQYEHPSCEIPLQRVMEIVDEAGTLGMRAFDISGGELFTYKHWEKLLRRIHDNDMVTNIATKYPLTEREIEAMKDAGLNRIQLSLDTVIEEEMSRLYSVNGSYHGKILKTLENLDKHGIETRINSQVTSINQDSIEALFDHVLQYENVRLVRVRPVGYSRFPQEHGFKELQPATERLKQLREYVEEQRIKHGDRVKLFFFKPLDESNINASNRQKREHFDARPRNSGNFFSFCLLHNGKVTVTEELYEHPKFIIGNLVNQSILEMWNSKEALAIHNLSPGDVSEQSACRSCPKYISCHQGKGVSWVLVLYAYGDDKWDWPDPRCEFAPPPTNQYWLSNNTNSPGLWFKNGTGTTP